MARGKYVLIGVLLLIAGFQALQIEQRMGASPEELRTGAPSRASVPTLGQVERAFQQRRSNVQVEGQGVVTKLLSDDNDGSRHQRFILQLAHGQTLLVAHNIDLAPRIDSLHEGDVVRFCGEYEWNEKGGVLHWTHHDPQGRHTSGWLEHADRRYE
jgi:Protein of unknown function (DUF3465)